MESPERPPHAGRAVLAAARAFCQEEATVWEYVALCLQRHGAGDAPSIEIRVRAAEQAVEIRDSGRGMTDEDLCRAFAVNGGRPERWDGRPSSQEPSRWATAAFGIADRLEIETVQDGRQQRVLLTRTALAQAPDGEFPLQWLIRNEPTSRPPGTRITLEEIPAPEPDAGRIAAYLERRLASRSGARPRLSVDGRPCASAPPAVAFTCTCRPSPEQAAVLGDVSLFLALTRAPLPAAQRGILVLGAAGNLLGIERGGGESVACAEHLYGEVTVPSLDAPAALAGCGPDRTLRLNPGHPAAVALGAFVRAKVQEISGQLAAQDRTAAWYRRRMEA